jgi:hypothetical protein
MTIKKRGPLARSCIPKYNHDLASSIVVTCVLDVALVTVCSVVGVLYPISSTLHEYHSNIVGNAAVMISVGVG